MAQDVNEYRRLTGLFRRATNRRWPETDRCCQQVRDGAPECCYQIVDGAELTYTPQEAEVLAGLWRRDPMLVDGADGMLVLDRDWWTPPLIGQQLWQGVLAGTLEAASHPTRPVLTDGQVTGVAVLDACNGPLAMPAYQAWGEQLRYWWQQVVDLVGVKAYYCTEFVRDDMTVVGADTGG